jgi:Fe-S cluster biogenesis protein NfuA
MNLQATNEIKPHHYSAEIIFHFTCQTCRKWWSIADWTPVETLTCPHCSTTSSVEESPNLIEEQENMVSIISGTVAVADVPNANGVVYPKEVLEDLVKNNKNFSMEEDNLTVKIETAYSELKELHNKYDIIGFDMEKVESLKSELEQEIDISPISSETIEQLTREGYLGKLVNMDIPEFTEQEKQDEAYLLKGPCNTCGCRDTTSTTASGYICLSGSPMPREKFCKDWRRKG